MTPPASLPLVAILGLAIPLATAVRGPVPDDPSPDWRAGPIRFILTVDEDKAYHALATDDERRAFIEAFWEALDPTPETPENERRAEFWKRVADATDLYHEALPGWKTDRGKAHILMGPPDRTLNQGSQVVWIYDALPRPDAPPEVRLTFVRMTEGRYAMDAGSLLYMDPLAEAAGPPAGETFLAAPGSGSSPRMLKERIRMTDFPAAETRSDYFVQTLDFRWRFHFYRGQDDETRSFFTLSVPLAQFAASGSATEGPDVSLSAVFDDAAHKHPARRLSGTMHLIDGTPGGSDRTLTYQAAWSLPPGSYDATVLVADRRSRRGATAQGKIEVPAFGRALSLSSIVLGRAHAKSETASGAAERMVTVPDPTATFAPGERMAIAYEVYNARHRNEKPSLDVEYTFSLRRGTETRRIGRPVVQTGQASDSQAFEVALQGWPPGSYTVQVKVTDHPTGRSATAEESFQVVAGAAP